MIYKLSEILKGTPDEVDNDLNIIRSFVKYKEGSNEMEYILLELEIKNTNGKKVHLFKAVKFYRLIKLPDSMKQSQKMMDIHADMLSGLNSSNIKFISILARIENTGNDSPIGLLQMYGVQGVGRSFEEAMAIADDDFAGLTAALQGNYRTIEFRYLNYKEAEWLREKMANMKNIQVVRGIPYANKGGAERSAKGFGGMDYDNSSEETSEQFAVGLADHDFINMVLSSPIKYEVIESWLTKTSKKQTYWNSIMQGSTSLNAGINIPIMFAANLGSSMGMSDGTSDSTSEGTSTSHSVSQGNSYSVSDSTSASTSQSNSFGASNSASASHSFSESAGTSQSVSTGESFGTSENVGLSYGISHSDGNSLGTSFGTSDSQSTGNSFGFGESHSAGDSVTNSESVGNSQSQSYGTSHSLGQSTNVGESQSVSHSSSHSTSSSSSSGSSGSHNYSYGGNSGTSNAINTGVNQGTSESSSNSVGVTVGARAKIISGSVNGSHSWGDGSSDGYSIGGSIGQTGGNSWSESGGNGWSSSTSSGVSNGTSDGASAGVSKGNGLSESTGTSFGTSYGTTTSQGQSVGHSTSNGISVSNSASTSSGTGESFGASLGKSDSDGWSQGVSQGYGKSYGQSISNGYGVSNSQGLGKSAGLSSGISQSVSSSSSQGVSHGTSQGVSSSESYGTGTSWGRSQGKSSSVSNSVSNGMSSSMGLGASLSIGKSYQFIDAEVQNIVELLEYQKNRYKSMINGKYGAFFVDVYIATEDNLGKSAARTAARAAWANNEAMVCPLQILEPEGKEQEHLLYHMNAFSPCAKKEVDRTGELESYKYTTILNAAELTAYTHVIRLSDGGLYADIQNIPELAVPSEMSGEIYIGKIISGYKWTLEKGYKTSYDYRISNDNIMHGLFAAGSRSGKTVAALRFVAELATNIRRKPYNKRMRIIAMDPKEDWRKLARYVEPERFRIYSMGDANFFPFKLNPLKVPYGVDAEFHLDTLIDIFCRSYGLGVRSVMILKDTIKDLYTNQAGVFETVDPEEVSARSATITLADVYKKLEKDKLDNKFGRDKSEAVDKVLDRLSGFAWEKGILNKLYCQKDGMSIDELLGEDDVVVLESGKIQANNMAFIFGFITASIYMYAKYCPHNFTGPDQFETVLVIEEANRVLSGEGGGNESGIQGQSIFEEMLDQAAGLGLFVMSITQKPSMMPSSILANSGLIWAGRMSVADDISVIMSILGKDERIDDKPIKKFFPLTPTGWFICKQSRTFDYKDSAPVLVGVDRLDVSTPTNEELTQMMSLREINKQAKKSSEQINMDMNNYNMSYQSNDGEMSDNNINYGPNEQTNYDNMYNNNGFNQQQNTNINYQNPRNSRFDILNHLREDD